MSDFYFMNTNIPSEDVGALYNHIIDLRAYARANPNDSLSRIRAEQVHNMFRDGQENQPVIAHYQYANSMQQNAQQRQSEVVSQLQQAKNSLSELATLKTQLQDEYTTVLSRNSEQIADVEHKIRDAAQQVEVLEMRVIALKDIKLETTEIAIIWKVTTNNIKHILAKNEVKKEKDLFLQELEKFKQHYQRTRAASQLDSGSHLIGWANEQIKEQLFSARHNLTDLSASIIEQFNAELIKQ